MEKIREDNAKRYDPEKAKAYQERRRELYQEKKRDGICVRCSKKASYGIYCYEHYIKECRRRAKRCQDAKMRRHDRGLIPEKRKAEGLCIWCGEMAVSGTNACERHIKIFHDAGKKGSVKGAINFGNWQNRRI
ncbi:MAG: hypothetical protein NC389_06200 [Acetatifactor muris]|nr:hypothetical protein [Acetatifactor muris]